jgi:hypothetical protein
MMARPDESDMERSRREWVENFQRVQSNPDAASETDLRRALHYLSHVREFTFRNARESGRTLGPNVVASYNNEEEYLTGLIKRREARRGARDSTDRAARLHRALDAVLDRTMGKARDVVGDPGSGNADANYYGVVGGYAGAFKGANGKWVGVREFNRHLDLKPNPLRRWQGPPNAAIVRALKDPSY